MNKSIHAFVVLAYKESQYLEQCVKSVLRQDYKSDVVIATSTPNDFIRSIGKKYNLPIIENRDTRKGIGYDFEFARKCVDNTLVTIAHQDDIYDKDYSERIVNEYLRNKDSLIIFSDYYEIRDNKKVYSNLNLKIKRILLQPLKLRFRGNWIKRRVLSFGNPICCPAVTFVNANIRHNEIFSSNIQSNVDWKAWEILSKECGKFIFVPKPLMGHRIHEESTTSYIIKKNIRTKEDYSVLCYFWPKWIAKIIASVYSLSEKSYMTNHK
ncbi:MAG: glycosyltransferase [Clostridiales bacterium]|nr:glycosyltransferase [Clostridiales bacterium]